MGSRLVLYALAGAMVLVGCLDRKTGNPDANPNDKVDLGLPSDTLVPNPQAGDSDGLIRDVAPPPPDRDASQEVPRLDGATLPGGGGGSSPGGATGSGGIVGSTGGATGSGGAVGTGGVSTTVVLTARGGAMATGGIVGTGGVTGKGGTVGTGGLIGTGGITGTGGTTCQPRSRDCTSPLDNDCNGKPDNQETTYCACPAGESRACLEHPGYDGKGICKAGSQSCTASTDKKTSAWTDCAGAIAPATEVCDSAGVDENCSGQSNEGCECVNGTSIPCDCGPATTCTNGKKGTCSVSKVTMYLDSDGDTYGDPGRPAQVCPGSAGYSSNGDDCDDANGAIKPGVAVCDSDSVRKKSCKVSGGGVWMTESCPDGCFNGICRNDGTVGLPNYVSCTDTHSPRCLATVGCNVSDKICGTKQFQTYHCDGPNDCPAGQKCWHGSSMGLNETICALSQPSAIYRELCDPLAGTCNCLPDGFLFDCQ